MLLIAIDCFVRAHFWGKKNIINKNESLARHAIIDAFMWTEEGLV